MSVLEGSTCSGQVFQEKVPLGGCCPRCRPWPASLVRGSAPGHTAWVLPPPPGPGCMAWLQTPPVLSVGCLCAVPDMHKCVWWPCSLTLLTYKKCDCEISEGRKRKLWELVTGLLSRLIHSGSQDAQGRVFRAWAGSSVCGPHGSSCPLGCGGKAGVGRWESRHQ